jgi:hypothetical protein
MYINRAAEYEEDASRGELNMRINKASRRLIPMYP